ncbi:MAG: tetratricopeptide repeat protein [Isosphaeraceae bacterium]
MAKALELAPDDREVLIAAAMAAEQKQDLATMRTYLARGHENDPKDIHFAESLARVEMAAGHLDRAEAVLRRSFEARPLPELAFELANTLILEGKIEGKDGAEALIDKLRRAGLGETLVRFLDAEVLFRRKKWREAIAELQTARAVLGSSPALVLRINRMIAECHGRLGSDEERLEALRLASAGKEGAESARLELVRVLAQSGRLDQAIVALSPLAIGGTNPEWRIDLVRLLLQKAIRQPRNRRDWPEIERRLKEAEKALSATSEPVVLLRLDVLTAQNRFEEARALLSDSQAREPRNLNYRLAMARLTQLQHRDDEALRIIDQAEKDLGANPQIDFARLDCWGDRGGESAIAAMTKLAEKRAGIPAADRLWLLDRLETVAIRLGQLNLARQYGHELAELQPDNIGVQLRLFDLAVMAGDRDDPGRLVEEIRKIEGEDGINWRFARAALLIDQAGRSSSVNLDEARHLAAEISKRQPNSWIGPTLNGEIARLTGSTDQAIEHYLKALELGNVQPSFARRLVALLDQQGRSADIGRVTQILHDQGAALAEVTLIQALDAIRKRDYHAGIELARQVFLETSTNSADQLNLGRIYLAAGLDGEAGKAFLRAVELGRGVPENWLGYVQYLVQVKQGGRAKAVMEAARKALPPDRATLTLAQCALIVGDTVQAETLVQQAMDAEGKAADLAALRIAVDVNLRLNRPDAARRYLDRITDSATATPGDIAWAIRTRALLLLATNRPADREQALALVDRNLTKAPESVGDLSLKATILALRPARRGEAVAILERLAGTNRLGEDQRFLLAHLYLGQGKESTYQDQMQKLLATQARNPLHLAHFANHWIARNQLDQADHWLSELKKVDPRGRPALELEARLLDLRKRRGELLSLLQGRGHEAPDEIGAVADLLDRHGFAMEAEAAYRAFVAREPGQPERSLALAQFLVRQRRVPEAMKILEKAWTTCRPELVATAALPLYHAPSANEVQKLQVEGWIAEAVQKRPDSVGLATNLGIIRIFQGRFDEAEALNRRILKNEPENAGALNTLAWLLALRDQSKAEEALGLITRAVEIDGPNPTLLDTLAVVLIRRGKFDRAVEQLTRAQQRVPGKPSLALHLAWAYSEEGKCEEAREQFIKAEKLGLKIESLDPLERLIIRKLHDDLFTVETPR